MRKVQASKLLHGPIHWPLTPIRVGGVQQTAAWRIFGFSR